MPPYLLSCATKLFYNNPYIGIIPHHSVLLHSNPPQVSQTLSYTDGMG